MKNIPSKSPLKTALEPLHKKDYEPYHEQTASDSKTSQAFIHPWQIPLGFTATKKGSISDLDIRKPKICNHYFWELRDYPYKAFINNINAFSNFFIRLDAAAPFEDQLKSLSSLSEIATNGEFSIRCLTIREKRPGQKSAEPWENSQKTFSPNMPD